MDSAIKFRTWYKGELKGQKMEHLTLSELCDIGSDDCHAFYYMRYTGLKDKNGVEIYEGDIVRIKDDEFHHDINTVVWELGSFILDKQTQDTAELELLTKYSFEDERNYTELEIIGNIYEHPHLLKEVS